MKRLTRRAKSSGRERPPESSSRERPPESPSSTAAPSPQAAEEDLPGIDAAPPPDRPEESPRSRVSHRRPPSLKIRSRSRGRSSASDGGARGGGRSRSRARSKSRGRSSRATSSVALPPPDGAEDQGNSSHYVGRRSNRVPAGRINSDGDTWVENLAVVEAPAGSSAGGGGGGGGESGQPGSSGSGGRSGGGVGRLGLGRRNRSGGRRGSADGGAGAEGGTGQPPSSPGGGGGGAHAVPDGPLSSDEPDAPLTIRSYFESQATGKRVWDEPPSGACNVVYASEGVRQMAEVQMRDLQVTVVPTDGGRDSGGGNVAGAVSMDEQAGANQQQTRHEKKGGMFGGLRNLGKKKTRDPESSKENKVERRIVYRRGVTPFGAEMAAQAHEQAAFDRDLQAAVMMSLGGGDGAAAATEGAAAAFPATAGIQIEGGAMAQNGGVQNGAACTDEEEAIAMAKALSMSEAEAQRSSQRKVHTNGGAGSAAEEAEEDGGEAEVLRRALEASRIEQQEQSPPSPSPSPPDAAAAKGGDPFADVYPSGSSVSSLTDQTGTNNVAVSGGPKTTGLDDDVVEGGENHKFPAAAAAPRKAEPQWKRLNQKAQRTVDPRKDFDPYAPTSSSAAHT